MTEPKLPQLPVISAAARAPSHVELILQTPYRCTRQDGWTQQTPINFGGVKLADAADPGYCFHGHDEMVLDYDDVGSTISGRLNVRGLFQTPPDMSFHVHFPFQINGKAIGKLKVGATSY